MGVAELAILIGLVNGVILIIRPVSRIHSRIDKLEFRVDDLKEDVDKILGASGIKRARDE